MPQARLTDDEIRRLPTGNQNSEDPSVIEWQVVKAAAIRYGIEDWTALVDGSLSYEENVDLLRQRSTTEFGGPTMREMRQVAGLQYMERGCR